jgi:hypothetical protein
MCNEIFILNAAWVQHDSDGGAHGFCWQILGKLGSNNLKKTLTLSLQTTYSVVSVRSGNFSPNDTDFTSINDSLGAVNVCHSFTEVESSVLSSLDIVNFNQRRVGSLVALSTLESKESSLLEKSDS